MSNNLKLYKATQSRENIYGVIVETTYIVADSLKSAASAMLSDADSIEFISDKTIIDVTMHEDEKAT